MSVHVFVGPTLQRHEIAELLSSAQIHEPAAVGDVYRAAKSGARAIGIIDGYFERIPAVWHKEILWAMAEGVHVFGAASMGALRAAELADFGMRGIGAVYEAFRSGTLEDDDEVAIAHASSEHDFAAHSEAMVNLRATFDAAAEAKIIGTKTAETLSGTAKSRFYADRSYPVAIRDARALGADSKELDALVAWLPHGRVDRKADDARALILHLREWLDGDPQPLRVGYRLERTDAWLEAMRVADAAPSAAPSAAARYEALEEELKIAGVYAAARDAAAARAAAVHQARRAGFRPDPAAVAHAAEALRQDLGLLQRDEFESWRRRERIDDSRLVALFEDQARVLWAEQANGASIEAFLVDSLRVTSRYGSFIERAEAKAHAIRDAGPRGPSLSSLGIEERELWRWYFRERLAQPEPESLHAFARELGFRDVDELRAAVVRERYVCDSRK